MSDPATRYALYALPAPGSALEAFGRAVPGYDITAGLEDLAAVPGLRADLARVRLADGVPVMREVWRAGAWIA